MKVALIVSTYNRPDALDLCLKSILNQRVLPDEILIADDGSGNETRELINQYKEKNIVPIHHIWHKDDGFKLAQIRNKAIAQSSCDYIIQIDGDLILHPYFIKDHKEFAKPQSFVRASRVYLSEKLTNEKLSYKDINIKLFQPGISNIFSSFRISFLRFLFEKKYKIKGDELWEIHGCNMAYWREDAIKVNGYNEDFVGWGPEDKEFVARLVNLGLKKRFLKCGGIAYHLWHPINSKDNLSRNISIFEETKFSKRLFCQSGINKYLYN